MSYFGTTSTAPNPPVEVSQGIAPVSTAYATFPGNRVWRYNSTMSATEPAVPGYFTDGKNLGMKTGDIVMGVLGTTGGSSSPIAYLGVVGLVSTSGASLSSNILTSTAV